MQSGKLEKEVHTSTGNGEEFGGLPVWLSAKVMMLSIAAIAVLVYLPSFWVPFYLDDQSSIYGNERLINGDYLAYLQDHARRVIAYSTLLVDYVIWGSNPTGYHLFNVVLHALNAVLVFALVRLLGNSLEHTDSHKVVGFALVVALIWATHPLNSQAVVYIVQRITVIATFFYLISLIQWVKYRQTGHLKYLTFAFIAAGAGVLSKEFVLTVPAVWLAIDYLVFKRPIKVIVRWLLVGLILVALGVIAGTSSQGAEFWSWLDTMTRDHEVMGRTEYFWAQQEVVSQYLYKILWPYPLLLEYPFYSGQTLSAVWPYFALHISMMTIAVCLVRKVPLFTLGIFIYYVSQVVEGGFIPIRDLGVEHRVYFANIGLILALAALTGKLFPKINARTYVLFGLVLALVLSGLSIHRTIQWQDRITFYQNELMHNDDHPRVQHTMGIMLVESSRYNDAEPYLRSAFLDAFERDAMTLTVARSFLEITIQLEDYAVAQRFTQEILQTFSRRPDWQAEILATYANIFVQQGACDQALQVYEQALQLSPGNLRVRRLRQQCSP